MQPWTLCAALVLLMILVSIAYTVFNVLYTSDAIVSAHLEQTAGTCIIFFLKFVLNGVYFRCLKLSFKVEFYHN